MAQFPRRVGVRLYLFVSKEVLARPADDGKVSPAERCRGIKDRLERFTRGDWQKLHQEALDCAAACQGQRVRESSIAADDPSTCSQALDGQGIDGSRRRRRSGQPRPEGGSAPRQHNGEGWMEEEEEAGPPPRRTRRNANIFLRYAQTYKLVRRYFSLVRVHEFARPGVFRAFLDVPTPHVHPMEGS